MATECTPVIRVAVASADFIGQAQQLADKLSLPMHSAGSDAYDYLLEYSDSGLALVPSADKGYGSIRCDFAGSEHSHRRRHGGGNGQAIAKAVGVSGKFAPQVLDLTAGLGGDGFVLASLGCTVAMLERNPIVHSLLADGLSRGGEKSRGCESTGYDSRDPELDEIINRLSLLEGSAADYLNSLAEQLISSEAEVWRPDIVYIDPMFPMRKKSAKVKKQMQAFHAIVGADNDADQLLASALAVAQYRVVVKRPAGAGFLAQTKPSYSLEGKSTRYDIYALKKLPQ